jgi:hypothetical protein
MSKLARFFATSVLVVSLSAVALADGGETQGSDLASPAPCAESNTGSSGSIALSPTQDSAIEIATEVTLLVALLTSAIL